MNKTIKYFDSPSKESLEKYLEEFRDENPDGSIFAMVAETDKDYVTEIQSVAKKFSVPLVGAIFPALIYDFEFKKSGVLFFGLPYSPDYCMKEVEPGGIEQVENLANSISKDLSHSLENKEEDKSLLIVFDAMIPNIATILDELYVQFGDSVQYMGINAGSESFQPMDCIFNEDAIISNGMLIIMMQPHKGAVLEHGYKVPEKTISATSTTGNKISTIDWKPAFEVYSEKIKEQFDVDITAENFYQYSVHFPFGITRADGEILVRIPVILNEDKSLLCVGEIPENSILTLLDAPKPESLHTVENLAKKTEENSTNLLFYCAGRKMHLKEGAEKELKDLKSLKKGSDYHGALTLGEIGSSHKGGYPLFHNATLVVIGSISKN